VDWQKTRKRVESLEAKRRAVVEMLALAKRDLSLAQAEEDKAVQARDVLQQVGQAVQQEAHQSIAAVVSRCLSSVFPEEPYEFKVLFERKRNRTEARLVFVKDGMELPAKEIGNGVLDVASFALRTACLIMTKPALTRFLVIDEPFRGVHGPRRKSVAELVEEVSQELGVQVLCITHEREMEMGTVVEIE
jgi:ABC-type branched-subunit amino acid transport system ATPase component